MRASLLLAAAALLTAGDPALAQAAPSDSAAIHQLGREFSSAYMVGDAKAMTALYTPDAVIFPERSDAVTGPDAIKRYWTLGEGRRVTRHQLTPTRLVIDGKHACEHGTYEIAGDENEKVAAPSNASDVRQSAT